MSVMHFFCNNCLCRICENGRVLHLAFRGGQFSHNLPREIPALGNDSLAVDVIAARVELTTLADRDDAALRVRQQWPAEVTATFE